MIFQLHFLIVLFFGTADNLTNGIADLRGFFAMMSTGTLSLMLHPPILKPHFDLSLGQIQRPGDLDSTRSAQVFVEMELFFQLQKLRIGVSRAQTAARG